MTDDDQLTPEEVAMYRPILLRFRKQTRQWCLGPHVMFDGWRLYLGVWIGRWQIGLIFQTFEGWRKARLSLGPYRNA